MKKYPKYLYTNRSINWFGCFNSIQEGILFIRMHGAVCRLNKEK